MRTATNRAARRKPSAPCPRRPPVSVQRYQHPGEPVSIGPDELGRIVRAIQQTPHFKFLDKLMRQQQEEADRKHAAEKQALFNAGIYSAASPKLSDTVVERMFCELCGPANGGGLERY